MEQYLGHRHRWGVILAGGEGARLRWLTRLISGDDRPKQFCPLLGGRTPLYQTRRRIARLIWEDRTVFSLLASQEPYYAPELRAVGDDRRVVQPANRGTLPAIATSLIRVAQRDPAALVAFFPSDHYYSHERRFARGVEEAFALAEERPQAVVLLGAEATAPEVQFGWIEAEPAPGKAGRGPRKITRFWEKPTQSVAEDLLSRGCMWNTFVMVARASALLNMIRNAARERFPELLPLLDESRSDLDLAELYRRLPSLDFSHQVLAPAEPGTLLVLPLGDSGWSDLGEPRRVIALLSEEGVKNEWSTRWRQVAAGASAA
jgi:mannose-1-phosphate guanylyltransferase